jgi:hypothetical protein
METQDEDRITYKYNSFIKTMPMATVIFTAPGMPLMMNGQEVGFGRGMGAPGEPDLNDRRRGIIDWNFEGKELLQPHYQRIAQIRSQFPAFSQHKKDTNGDGSVNSSDQSDFIRISTGDGVVYSFLRPYTDENGVAVANFSSSAKTVTLNLKDAGLKFTDEFDDATLYWVNNLYADSSYQKRGGELSALTVNLEAYGSAIFVISTESKTVDIPELPPMVSIEKRETQVANKFQLAQNYPNPFNPSTMINFTLPIAGKTDLTIYNILGQKIKTLFNSYLSAGYHMVEFKAKSLPSGIYFYRLKTGQGTIQKKMILLR